VDEDDANNNTAVSDTAPAPARDVPTGVTSRRRAGSGGKLSVSVMVRGHYNRGDVGVDFDSIVQDSINRDTPTIVRELTSFNKNCNNQTTKVVDLGYTVDDFLEVHSNRGVDLPRSRRQHMEMANVVDQQAFSSACNQRLVLPPYFEESLGGLKLKAKTEARVYVNEEESSNVGAILGGVIAGAVIALCVGFFLIRREKKKKLMKEVDVTHVIAQRGGRRADGLVAHAAGEKIRRFSTVSDEQMISSRSRGSLHSSRASETSPSMVAVPVREGERRGIAGRLQRELSNIGMAITDERRRIRGNDARRSGTQGGERHVSVRLGQSGLQSSVSVGEDGLVMPRDDHPRELSNVDTSNTSCSSNKVHSSRNAIPKIINRDLEDSFQSKERTSDDDSHNFSDDEDSSDSSSDSSSSSSEEESRIPTQLPSRKKRERKTTSDKTKTKKKGSKYRRQMS